MFPRLFLLTLGLVLFASSGRSADEKADPLYVRDEKTRGIPRWDVTIDPKQHGEKAMVIDYEFKMELDKNVNIGGFLAK